MLEPEPHLWELACKLAQEYVYSAMHIYPLTKRTTDERALRAALSYASALGRRNITPAHELLTYLEEATNDGHEDNMG